MMQAALKSLQAQKKKTRSVLDKAQSDLVRLDAAIAALSGKATAAKPIEDVHRSHAQGLMMRGIDPLLAGGTAAGVLDEPLKK